MIPILFAAASAAVYGSADYCGGTATRTTHPVTVTLLSQALSVPLILAAAFLAPGAAGTADVVWGAMAGAAGLVGLVLLYGALSHGAMAVVAPTTAVTAALVPLLAGLATEHWPRPVALVGVGCAVVAIALVSLAPNGERGVVTPALVASSVLAGSMFGLFFILLDRAGPQAGMWPLVSARITSVVVSAVVVLVLSAGFRPARPAWPWIVGAGVLDVTANALYLLAAQQGALSIVAPIASLYPVSTVLLALTVDREPVRAVQIVGLGFAAVALVLVSSST